MAVITQFMSDAATTALFAPVAIALASALGQPPEAFVVTVAMGFADFVRVGAPLTVVCALIVALLAPLVFGG